MTRNICVLLALCSCVAAAPVGAQENAAWPERAFVTIDVPFQALNNDFSDSLTVADSVRRSENVNFLMEYPSSQGVLFDLGAGVRLTSNLGIGITASWSERSSSGSFDLALPNPFFANSPLELAGSIPDLNRREMGFHFHALYAHSLGRRVRVMASGGPSIFNTRQDVVRGVEVDILPGFRALSFDQAMITRDEQTTLGFNVGADLTWAFARHFGIGTVTRYSRANITWKPVSESGISRSIRTQAGGLHIGAGVRLLF
jgi:hypothetical protein